MLVLVFGLVPAARAQTPSPMPYWQYSVGQVLLPLGGPINDWTMTYGGGGQVIPDYPGARGHLFQPAVIVDIRYRDTFFISDGEGVGVNLLRGPNYRAGIAVGYDLGRYASESQSGRIRTLADVSAAPEPKIFLDYSVLPFVFNAVVRHAIGGYNGLIADFGSYVPLPISDTITGFLGPTLTLANARYMRAYFGVTPDQAVGSPLRPYAPGGGFSSTGLGLMVVDFLSKRWFIESDAAFQRFLGQAADSPVVASRSQVSLGVHFGYRF